MIVVHQVLPAQPVVTTLSKNLSPTSAPYVQDKCYFPNGNIPVAFSEGLSRENLPVLLKNGQGEY